MDRRGVKGRRQNPTLARGRQAQQLVRAQRAAFVGRAPVGIAAVRRAQMGEKKGMDTDLALTGVINTTNTNANIFIANLVQQGAGSWNRIGRKIHTKSLRIKGHIQIQSTPVVATGVMLNNSVRMVVVWDQQPSGAAIPTWDTIFGITAQDGVESCPDFTCPPKYDNMDRFRVLLDRTYVATPNFVTSTGSGPSNIQYVPVDEYIKLGGLESVFLGQSAPMTIADISTGALYVGFRSMNNSAGNTANTDLVSRLRFVD